MITDEEELHKMSMECEPPLGGLPPPPPLSTVAFFLPSFFISFHLLQPDSEAESVSDALGSQLGLIHALPLLDRGETVRGEVAAAVCG